jgi:nitrate/nitrite transporter NarK
MKFKKDGIKLTTYMGRRWFVSKGILAIAALVMLLHTAKTVRPAGLVMLGYLLGVIGANVRSYFVTKTKWELQRELIDWDKVEEIAKST